MLSHDHQSRSLQKWLLYVQPILGVEWVRVGIFVFLRVTLWQVDPLLDSASNSLKYLDGLRRAELLPMSLVPGDVCFM